MGQPKQFDRSNNISWRDYCSMAFEIYKLACAGLVTLWLLALLVAYGCWKEWWLF